MKEQLNTILQKRWTLPAATAVAGLGVGTLVGYMFTKRQYDRIEAELARVDEENAQFSFDFKDAAMEAEVNRRLALELEKRMPLLGYASETVVDDAEALEHLREDHPSGGRRVITSAKIRSVGLHADGNGLPGTGIIDVQPVIEEDDGRLGTVTNIRETPGGIEVEGNVTEEGRRFFERTEKSQKHGVVKNVFGDGAGDEWDYKTELEARDKSKPYVIHADEYYTDEMGWDSQSTLTWYEKDEILTDSREVPIHNPRDVVGLPLAFGHGSNDPNVVYIRNEQLQAEYEVIRDPGSYQEEVLGEKMTQDAERDELRHSRNMRFRSD